jgi:hypothetical protein
MDREIKRLPTIFCSGAAVSRSCSDSVGQGLVGKGRVLPKPRPFPEMGEFIFRGEQ